MAVSQVGICNLALSYLGLSSIASMTEASAEAIQCNMHFDNARDFVLRDYTWNFATKRVTLAESGTITPPAEWAYAYSVPSDCLWARQIVVGSPMPAAEFALEVVGTGRVLYTNESPAILQYTARISETTLFDPMFIEALAWKMAAQICMPMTRDKSLMQMAMNMYVNNLAQAQRADANEGQPETPSNADWIEVRGIDGSIPAARIVR